MSSYTGEGPDLTTQEPNLYGRQTPSTDHQIKEIRHDFECSIFNTMKAIYQQTIESVANGAHFKINFEKRSLKVDGKYIIKDGNFEGELGCEPVENPLPDIERLFNRYRHSVPSQRSDSKSRKYFRALPEKDLSDEDMLYGVHREEAQVELELFILCQLIHGSLRWDDFAPDMWFWQSLNYPSLILLRKWVA